MVDLAQTFQSQMNQLDPTAGDWLQEAQARLARAEDSKDSLVPELFQLFPQLPRRMGRQNLSPAPYQQGEVILDLGAWRTCDGAALLLLNQALTQADLDQTTILDLYHHGDMEERNMVLRSMAALPLGSATIALLDEAQRSNTQPHFEAAICDSNLLSRSLTQQQIDQAMFNRMVLKLAFVDLPLSRVFGAQSHANAELSRMLQDLATEREAAGRRVWRDTNRLIARAPTTGSLARLAGSLEHGDDEHRLATAEALQHMHLHPWLLDLAQERLGREPVPAIRTALQAAVRQAS